MFFFHHHSSSPMSSATFVPGAVREMKHPKRNTGELDIKSEEKNGQRKTEEGRRKLREFKRKANEYKGQAAMRFSIKGMTWYCIVQVLCHLPLVPSAMREESTRT